MVSGHATGDLPFKSDFIFPVHIYIHSSMHFNYDEGLRRVKYCEYMFKHFQNSDETKMFSQHATPLKGQTVNDLEL